MKQIIPTSYLNFSPNQPSLPAHIEIMLIHEILNRLFNTKAQLVHITQEVSQDITSIISNSANLYGLTNDEALQKRQQQLLLITNHIKQTDQQIRNLAPRAYGSR